MEVRKSTVVMNNHMNEDIDACSDLTPPLMLTKVGRTRVGEIQELRIMASLDLGSGTG